MTNAGRYINIVEESSHGQKFTMEIVKACSEGFTKPVVFRNMVPVDPKMCTREFFEGIGEDKTVQWRRKHGDDAASMRTSDGRTDYNYVTGQVGSGSEFLDDIFDRKLDVYSHLGFISAGYKDPHEWGKIAFRRVKEEIFRSGWFQIANWKASGHMFFGHSNQEYGEPARGAVGSDWHMFPTLNVFVLIAGEKKWMTRPPRIMEQFEGDARMFSTSSGREAPGEEFDDYDTVHLTPGDVLLNLPYEWHKVLNRRGMSLGAALRIIDIDYIDGLARRPSTRANLPQFEDDVTEDVAHLLTSLKYASLHLNRAQMMLNDAEHAYPVLLKTMKKHRSPSGGKESQRYEIAIVD